MTPLEHHHLERLRDARRLRFPAISAKPTGLVERCGEARLPLSTGTFLAIAYRSTTTGLEHIALVMGDPAQTPGCLVRVHSECLTGDAFSSLRCDCGEQLQLAFRRIADEGCGIVVYVRGHEGRGIGLAEKILAYRLQDAGFDTVDANTHLGHAVDARTYDEAAHIVLDIGASTVRLLSNNPTKRAALAAHGLNVLAQVPLHIPENAENRRYLRTKREKMGHL
ncbi:MULTISPECIES: GTP cyclohydrolase II [unclassified Cupriavidus]|uniref:GTP cyclohydrolase II n=1 Tax=unclassified Cupriavidus TaxID=2640874 RepID=UPI003F8DE366